MPPSGNPFANLSPRQKRIAAILGIAGVLALIVLLSRRGEPPASASDATDADPLDDPYAAGVDPLSAQGLPPYDFGGANDAFAGQLSTAVTDALGSLQTSVDESQINRIPKAVGNLQHLQKRQRALLRRLDHRLDRLQGQGRGGRRGGGKRGGGKRRRPGSAKSTGGSRS